MSNPNHRVRGSHPIVEAYFARRYAILFYTLLLTLVASPLIAALQLSGTFIDVFFGANLVAAALPADAGRHRRVLLGAILFAWVGRWAMAWFGHPSVGEMILGLWTMIGFVAAGTALRFAMRARNVHAEHIYAALSAYLLVGVFFGLFYWVLEQVMPGTFNANEGLSHASAMYFSFVTLATLGYGDIVPRTEVARGLAVLEGVGGQLFLAVLVARLLSMYSARPKMD